MQWCSMVEYSLRGVVMLLAGQDSDAPSGCENRRPSDRSDDPGFDGGGARARA